MKESKNYKVSIITVDGNVITKETNNVEQTLSQFRPEIIKGKIIINAEKGDKKFTKTIFVPVARRLFYNGFALKIFARNIERALL